MASVAPMPAWHDGRFAIRAGIEKHNCIVVPIPGHDTRPEFEASRAFWAPSIEPSGPVISDGDRFAGWKGRSLIGGLVSRALIREGLKGCTAEEAERFERGERIREGEQGPEGALYVLEDGHGGCLMKLTPFLSFHRRVFRPHGRL